MGAGCCVIDVEMMARYYRITNQPYLIYLNI